MQIVIDIDDHKYTQIKEDAEKFRSKGMIVPYLYKVIDEAPYEDATKALEFAPTIVEANTVESEDK